MQNALTPGPWFIHPAHPCEVRDQDGTIIAEASPPVARAIVAVPEMIAALRNLVVWLDADRLGYCAPELCSVSLERHLDEARAALAKAGQA